MASAKAANLRQLAQTLQSQAEQLEAAESSGKPTSAILSDVTKLSDDLRLEARGSMQYMFDKARGYHDVATCAVISKFNLVKFVPDDGSISFEELSEQSGCPLDQMVRILRNATLIRLFEETTPGHISHSSLTRLWKGNELIDAGMGLLVLEFFPGAAFVAESLYKYGDGQEPTQAGIVLANGSTKPFFDILLGADPARLTRFNLSMKRTTASKEVAESRRRRYDWSSVNTLVDVGGGEGHIAADLAKANPNLKAVVLDFKETVDAGQKNLPAELADRVSFQAHDFFKDTPPKADAYFMNHILHDWPDKYCVKILKAIVPAMKPGSKILLGEIVMPEPGERAADEKIKRFHDFQMMMVCNSKERTKDQFVALLKEADSRLQLKKVYNDDDTPDAEAIVEIEFTG